MRVNAYVLLSDPTWLVRSVLGYYDHVDRIVASYDENGRTWTGDDQRGRMNWCLDWVQRIDRDNKVDLLPGDYARKGATPLDCDTLQRADAAAAASADADWVLQLDTDELLPNPAALIDVLTGAGGDEVAVEWPMRVLYRRLTRRRYLEVRSASGGPHFDYPGPVAVRAGTVPRKARQVPGAVTVRAVVDGRDEPTQLAAEGTRLVTIGLGDAIVHNSWARHPSSVLAKVRGWGHSDEINGQRYYATHWLPSPLLWPVLRDLHPMHGPWWPRLGVTRLS